MYTILIKEFKNFLRQPELGLAPTMAEKSSVRRKS
jgi:hypothetical protein